MDEPCLHETLEPACPLRKPRPQRRLGLLLGRRGEHRHPPPSPGDADAEVGVLRNVVRVPAAERLQRGAREVVRRPAERNRQVEPGQCRQQDVEQRRVFECELPRQRSYGANATASDATAPHLMSQWSDSLCFR